MTPPISRQSAGERGKSRPYNGLQLKKKRLTGPVWGHIINTVK